MINIFYLSHNRINFHPLTFYFLNKIKEENKEKIKLTILASHDYNWNKNLLTNIEVDVKVFLGENNYLSKIKYAITTDCEYSVKLDEDCFISNHTWDYMIENVSVLDEKNLLISPIMSNNIPSCDYFILDYIKDDETKKIIYSHFLKRPMPNGLWGVNYEPLNKYTIEAKEWDFNGFYSAVNNLPTTVKGIHPLRITYQAQVLINDYILNNLELFVMDTEKSFLELHAPYFTNSLFAIKTSEWRNILNHKTI